MPGSKLSPDLASSSLLLLLLLLLPPAPASAVDVFPVTVPANANIYGAGHAVPPAPGGNGAGVLPTLVTLPPGLQRTLTVSSVAGSIDFGPCCAPNDADGAATLGNAPSNNWDGLAGMTIPRGRFLGAVFLDDSEPADPPPARLSIPDIGFASLSPGLRQTFFVGDGLTGTGSGTQQVFEVPDTATRLFLGLHDAGAPDDSVPGWYGDNSGSVTADVEIHVGQAIPALDAAGRLALAAALLLAPGVAASLRKGRLAH